MKSKPDGHRPRAGCKEIAVPGEGLHGVQPAVAQPMDADAFGIDLWLRRKELQKARRTNPKR